MGFLPRVAAHHGPAVWRHEDRWLDRNGFVRTPLAVQWLVSNACDLHCPHCYSDAGRKIDGELDTAQAKRAIVDELVALGRPTLVLAGGELLLRRDIAELVAYAAARGIAWAMHTHGGHVHRHLDWISAHPPRLAAISLDGPQAEHDAFRGKAGSYRAALAAVRSLREIGVGEVVVGTTVTRRNADHLHALLPDVAASGAHTWGLHLFAPEGRGHEHLELFPTTAQLRRTVRFAQSTRRWFHVELCNEWGSAGADDHRVRDQPFSCGAGRISCVISPTGELLPCTVTDLRESAGNVLDTPLRELWLRSFGSFRDPAAGRCDDRECWLQARNGNACHARAFGEDDANAVPADVAKTEQHAAGPAAIDAPGALLVTLRARTPAPTASIRGESITPPARPSGPRLADAAALASARQFALGVVSAIVPVLASASCTRTEPPRDHKVPRPPDADTDARAVEMPALGDSELAALEAWPASFDDAALERWVMLRGTTTQGGVWALVKVAWAARRRSRGAGDDEGAEDPETLPHMLEFLVNTSGSEPRLREAAMRVAQAIADDVAGRPHVDASAAIALLDDVELLALWDPIWVAITWQALRAPDLGADASRTQAQSLARVRLAARLHRHARVTESLALTERDLGAVEFSPWRSKAMPPAGHRPLRIPEGFLPAAQRRFPTVAPALWEQDHCVELSARGGRAWRIRAGRAAAIKGAPPLTICRLDLVWIEGRAELSTQELGVLVGLDRALISPWNLPDGLSEAARARLHATLERARSGDEAALGDCDRLLPFIHRAIEATVAAHPQAAGAAALTQIRRAWDE